MADLSGLSDDELLKGLQSALGGALGGQQAPQAMPSETAKPNFVVDSINAGGTSATNLDALKQKQAIQNESSIEENRQKKIDEINLKREAYRKDLNTFLSIDEMIPRGEGYHRFSDGLQSMLESIGQQTPRGVAAAAHDAASKRLRVQLVRAAGDVGNINIVEQQAAEQLIPSIWDSEDVTKIKRAYLRQVGEGIDSQNPDLVVQSIKDFMKTKGYDKSRVKIPNKEVNLDEVFL